MDDKKLDLDAPIISVRRITASSAPSKDSKSGHAENSGAVPFIWEKRPGRPKDSSGEVAGGSTVAPNLPPGRILKIACKPKPYAVRTVMPITCSTECGTEKLMAERVGLNPADCGEECYAFSDAPDTLSCNESFSMKSGVTGLSVDPGFRVSTSQFSKDPHMEEYMMGRFLPAAQAMASGSQQQSRKKPPRASVVDKNFERKTMPRRRLPLHYQFQLSVATSHDNGRKEEEEEGSDEIASCENTSYFSSMARGLISRFGLKNTFCLLNPVPGMKVRDLPPMKLGRMSKPRIKSNDEGVVQDSWEAAIMQRLKNVDYLKKDFDNKLTTDSQTLDGSSSLNYKSKSSKTGSLDSDKEDIESYWEMASIMDRMQGSGSTSPAIERTQTNSSRLPDVCFDLKADGQGKNIDNSLALSLLPPPLPIPPSDSWLRRTLPNISSKGPYQQSFLVIQFHQMNETSRGSQKLVIPEKIF